MPASESLAKKLHDPSPVKTASEGKVHISTVYSDLIYEHLLEAETTIKAKLGLGRHYAFTMTHTAYEIRECLLKRNSESSYGMNSCNQQKK